jgi:hypothetical protein
MRLGGNPDLSKHQFSTDRQEPLTTQISIRVTASMAKKLKAQKNWQNLVREAISEKLQEIES